MNSCNRVKYVSYLMIAIFSAMLFACQPSKKKLTQQITQLENELFHYQGNTMSVDTQKAYSLIKAYEHFAHHFKNDTQVAEYLFRAADVYRSLKKTDECLALYDRIMKEFPQSSRAPYSLFLKGFLYENEINDLTKARHAYEAFLQQYPNHPLSDDVKFSLQHLGKTPEELIQLFDQMNKDTLAP